MARCKNKNTIYFYDKEINGIFVIEKNKKRYMKKMLKNRGF